MVEVGTPVKVRIQRKRGENKKPKITYKDAVVIKTYENFVVVRFQAGYNECFRESELKI